jgi:hypothetical protein
MIIVITNIVYGYRTGTAADSDIRAVPGYYMKLYLKTGRLKLPIRILQMGSDNPFGGIFISKFSSQPGQAGIDE